MCIAFPLPSAGDSPLTGWAYAADRYVGAGPGGYHVCSTLRPTLSTSRGERTRACPIRLRFHSGSTTGFVPPYWKHRAGLLRLRRVGHAPRPPDRWGVDVI